MEEGERNGAGCALGIERTPEIDFEFQHSANSSSRVGLG